jgi:enoyl reductase-like protein
MDARGSLHISKDLITQARTSVDAKGPLHILKGPITRAKVKKIKEALNELIEDIKTNQVSNSANSSLTKSRGLSNIIGVLNGSC